MHLKLPFQRKALNVTPDALDVFASGQFSPYPTLGGGPDTQQIKATWIQGQSASYSHLYQYQPAVRAVVDYIARNIAQMGLLVYRHVDVLERELIHDHPAAQSLRSPNPWTPGMKLIFNLIADFLVYDNAYILKFATGGSGPVTMVNVPPQAVALVGRELFNPEEYRFYRMDGTFLTVNPVDVIHIRGYDPASPRGGFSKLETLRQELAADSTARQAKTELDKAGLMPRGWIERPEAAPELSPEQRDRLREQLSNWGRQSTRKIPILEEGMTFKTAPVSPAEAEMLEARKFTHQEVNAIYGLQNVPPTNEDERRQVYSDVLPPYCELVTAYLKLGLFEQEYQDDELYCQFNLDDKLRGESDKRWIAITSSVGAPWRTRNEARALENYPPVPGGDELVIPLNVSGAVRVTERVQEQPGFQPGGAAGDPTSNAQPNPLLPAPNVMPIQDPNKPPQDGSYRRQGRASMDDVEYKQLHTTTVPRTVADRERQQRAIEKVSQVMERYYKRQQTAMQRKAANGASANTANAERWNSELASDLAKVITNIFELEGGIYLSRLGGAVFDIGKRINYIAAMAHGIADAVNQVTQSDISSHGAEAAFSKALSERVATVASSVGSSAVREARYEAAAQAPGGGEGRVKTWVADTDRHRQFDGETVPIDAHFSSGFEPGTPANCKCAVSIA